MTTLASKHHEVDTFALLYTMFKQRGERRMITVQQLRAFAHAQYGWLPIEESLSKLIKCKYVRYHTTKRGRWYAPTALGMQRFERLVDTPQGKPAHTLERLQQAYAEALQV